MNASCHMMLQPYLHSIPIDNTISIIRKQLEEDRDLKSRTNMTINHICCLLEFCLKNTYFKFNGAFYEQKEGAAMGSPISLIVANLVHGGSGNQSYKNIQDTTKDMKKICRWYFHHHQERKYKQLSTTSQLHTPQYKIH